MGSMDEAIAEVRTGKPVRAAARDNGVARSTLQDHLTRAEIPIGYNIKSTSTMYSADGEVKLQWVKTDVNKEEQEASLKAAMEGLMADLPKSEPIPHTITSVKNLLTLYPIGDHHFGMLSWMPETGASRGYDLKEASRLLNGAFDHLVEASPASEECAIMVLGDFLHFSGYEPTTERSKNVLDADGRLPKMIRAAMEGIRYAVRAALKRHKTVRLQFDPGNHDTSATPYLKEGFRMIYENEPRVFVDSNARNFNCFTFGDNFIGSHHGHSVKLPSLPLLFATDYSSFWGVTRHRTIHTGHVHHDQVKEYVGCTVESHGILPPQDAYAAQNGYRSKSSMKAIVLHKQYGEVARHTVNPEMLT